MGGIFKNIRLQYTARVLSTFVLIGVLLEVYFFFMYSTLHVREASGNASLDSPQLVKDRPPAGYLVWTDNCHMKSVDPFSKEVMNKFKKLDYIPCTSTQPLTSVLFDPKTRTYSLHIDESVNANLIGYQNNVSCCYMSVLRHGSGETVDMDFELESCTPFQDGYVLPSHVDGFIVICDSLRDVHEVQRDAFFVVPEKPEVRARLDAFKLKNDKERPASVLLLGIDSMSRFNLRRVMPETTKVLVENGWFELSGYNKVDDNTFPNLMALLSGYNMHTAHSRCNLSQPGGLDSCNLIWELFRENGYVTGYAEDATSMSTFDYSVGGFRNIPVDYYQRPFMLAIEENLDKQELSKMTFCIGLRHSADYIFDFALELATRYKSEPYFGLFWTNSFSHNSFKDASAMDSRIADYIGEMRIRGILDDAIVIFLSDHGSRFGLLRSLSEGFLEERLPFIFIWLPMWFRTKHPDLVNALELNQYRLTNPYDIHITLKHILELSGRVGKLPKAVDCENCQSVFVPIPEDRSCKDVAIDDHWCTCFPFEDVPIETKEMVDGIESILNEINAYLSVGGFSPPCGLLMLHTIEDAKIKLSLESSKESANKSEINVYRVQFSVLAFKHVKFEASFEYSKTSKKYHTIGSVSRLTAYQNMSDCISDATASKYCICDSGGL